MNNKTTNATTVGMATCCSNQLRVSLKNARVAATGAIPTRLGGGTTPTNQRRARRRAHARHSGSAVETGTRGRNKPGGGSHKSAVVAPRARPE